MPPEDAGALADGLERVLTDNAVASRLAELGRSRAKEFTWRRCAEATLRVYESAAQS